MVSFVNAFIGPQQSKYAAVAILIALIAISLSILLGADKIPLGQKFLFVFIILLMSLPSILYTLFQMSCIVTGASGSRGNWWCGAFAWFLVAIVVIYTFLVVIVAILSIINKKSMLETEEFYSNKEMFDEAARDFIQEEYEDEMKKHQKAGEAFNNIRGGASEPYELPTMMAAATAPVEAFQSSVFGGTEIQGELQLGGQKYNKQ
jgi:hypothetical protein